MHRIARAIARWIIPYISNHLTSALEDLAYNHTINREMIEALAHDLDREITFDLQTGVVTIHPLRKA